MNWQIVVPIVNLFVLVVGSFYGLVTLKVFLTNAIEKLDRVTKLVEEHEKRITYIEGHLNIGGAAPGVKLRPHAA